MDLKTVIKEIFLSEYPEYDNPQTKITVNINGRFDKNGGDVVLEMPHPKYPEYNTFIYYWFTRIRSLKQREKKANGWRQSWGFGEIVGIYIKNLG